MSLEFEQPTYLGTIRDNSLQELVLSLTSGYHGEIVNTEVLGGMLLHNKYNFST